MTKEQVRAAIAATVYTNVTKDVKGNTVRDRLIDSLNAVQLEATGTNGAGVKQTFCPPFGGGSITLTNGQSIISGVGTNFQEATAPNGVAYWEWLFVEQGGQMFVVYLTITDATTAEIASHYNFSQDPFETTDLGTTWTGQTATFDPGQWGVLANAGADLSILGGWGNSLVSANSDPEIPVFGFFNFCTIDASGAYGAVFGNFNRTFFGDEIVLGKSNEVTGNNAVFGASNKVRRGNAQSVCIGFSNDVDVNSNPTVIAGGNNTIRFMEFGGVLACVGSTLGTPTATGQPVNVVFIGFENALVDSQGFQNTVVMPGLNLQNIGTYADDAAAGAAGLIAKQVYQTPTGELRIKL